MGGGGGGGEGGGGEGGKGALLSIYGYENVQMPVARDCSNDASPLKRHLFHITTCAQTLFPVPVFPFYSTPALNMAGRAC